MRLRGRSLRWLLPVLLFLAAAPHTLAHNSGTAVLIEQAKGGDGMAQLNLGLAYANALGGLPTDDDQAAYWFRKAAEQGYPEAQYALGNLYAEGRGVPQDDTEAVRWFREAAEQGHAAAQVSLGLRHFYGAGVPKNEMEAYFWLNLGTSALDDIARSVRDKVEAKLTAAKRLQIHERCRKWQDVHSQICSGGEQSIVFSAPY